MSRPSDIYPPGSLDKTTPLPTVEKDKADKILKDYICRCWTCANKDMIEIDKNVIQQLRNHFSKLDYEKACGCEPRAGQVVINQWSSKGDAERLTNTMWKRNLAKAFNQEGTKEGDEQ